MVLDTSAIVAMLSGEPDAAIFRDAVLKAPSMSISAVTVLETRIVLQSRFGERAVQDFDEMLATGAINVVPFDSISAEVAFDAFKQFGKGQGHPAQLNIIDCAAYTVAKIMKEPLLFKGNDFGKTDAASAL